MHSGSSDVGENAQEDHRYPFAGAVGICFVWLLHDAGEENPKVKLFVVSTASGDAAAGTPPKATGFDLTGPFGEDFYLGRGMS